MSAVGIVGAGHGAVLHAEAVRATAGMRLAGVAATSVTSQRAAAFAGALDCAVLEVADLARACDVAVIATPPAAYRQVANELAAAGRVRAVLFESPVATNLDDIERLAEALGHLQAMVGVNLLHAPAVRQFMTTVASMNPHHLELRLAVPSPSRARELSDDYGGGVLMDPAAGLWPVLLAALGAGVDYVATPHLRPQAGLRFTPAKPIEHRLPDELDQRADLSLGTVRGREVQPQDELDPRTDLSRGVRLVFGDEQQNELDPRTDLSSQGGKGAQDALGLGDAHIPQEEREARNDLDLSDGFDVQAGLEHAARVVLRSRDGRNASADLRWSAAVAEASLEAADTAHVARIEIWPEPVLEIDGIAVRPPSREVPAGNPLVALGFTEQLRRLVRAGRGEAAPWPDLTAGAAAVTIAAAAAASARRGGSEVATAEIVSDLAGLSPRQILNIPAG